MKLFTCRAVLIAAVTTAACGEPPAAGPTEDAGRSDASLGDGDADAALGPIDGGEAPPDAGPLPACPDGDGPAIVAVAGELTHEGMLRISGCRFGVKERPEPTLYDTVDNQPAYGTLSTGDRIPTDGDAPWTSNAGPYRSPVRLADEDPRGHRAAFYRASGDTHGGDGGLGWPRALGARSPPADQRLLYVSWWYRPSMSPGGGDPEGSNKFIRIWDDSGGNGTRLSWTHMHITYSGAEHPGWRRWTEDGRVGEWNRLEITVDADRGTIRHYLNGVYQQVSNSSVGAFDIDDFVKKPEYADVGLNVGIMGFDHGLSSYGDMITDFGEIYLDTTRARVEIGDAPTWAEARRKEVQIPTAWDEDGIEVRLQEGTFDGFPGRFLYVVDAEGRVNLEGFPL